MTKSTGVGRGRKQSIQTAENRAEALKLRKAGLTYDQIAKELGYANRGSVSRLISEALEGLVREPAQQVLDLELQRLDALVVGLWPKASRGDAKSVHAVLAVMGRRAKYLGLDDYESRIADVAERRVALEEAQAIVVVTLIRNILDGLDLTQEQRDLAGEVVPTQLRLIDAIPNDEEPA